MGMSDALTATQAAVVPPGFVMEPWQRGFGRTIGPFYTRDDPDGGVTMGFRVEEHHANGAMNCHGGMLTSFADMAWGRAGLKEPGQGWFTVRLLTDFLSGARMGEWVEARAELVSQEGDLYNVRGRLWTGDRTIMTGTGLFKVVEIDPLIRQHVRGGP